MLRILEDASPLMVMITSPEGWNETTVRQMSDSFERLWTKRERYGLISFSPKGAPMASASARKAIGDFANSSRVRKMSREYCVGSSTVVSNALMRGALTAIMWVWTPASPHYAAANPREAVDWCLEKIRLADLAPQKTAAEMRRIALELMKE